MAASETRRVVIREGCCDRGDEHNFELARAVAEDGRLLIASTEADARTWLRTCFVNHRTTEEDVRVVPEVVGEVSDTLLAAAR